MSETVSITEAAKRLGVSTKTIARHLDSGKLRCVVADGKRRVILPGNAPDTTGHSDATEYGTHDQTQSDIETLESLRAERDALVRERDREREEVEFLRQRVAELNSIVMRHALSLPAPQGALQLDSTAQDSETLTGQDRTGHRTDNVPTVRDTRPVKRQLPLWLRFFGFRF